MPSAADQRQIDTGPAEAQEKYLVPAIFGPWAQEVVDRAALAANEQVLDLACGTGPAARLAAKRAAGRVVGLDIDAASLAVAASRADAEGAAVEWVEGSALDLPFAGQDFDAVLCCQALQFFPDRVRALGEMRRVLKPAGRLVASVWRTIDHCAGHFAVAQAMAEQAGAAPATLPPFSLGDAEELRSLAAEAGFADITIVAVAKVARFGSADGFVAALAAGAPSTRHALAKFDDDARQSIMRRVATLLAPYGDEDGLGIPMESHILTARA